MGHFVMSRLRYRYINLEVIIHRYCCLKIGLICCNGNNNYVVKKVSNVRFIKAIKQYFTCCAVPHLGRFHQTCTEIRSLSPANKTHCTQVPHCLPYKGVACNTEAESVLPYSATLFPCGWTTHWGLTPSWHFLTLLEHMDQPPNKNVRSTEISPDDVWQCFPDLVSAPQNIISTVQATEPPLSAWNLAMAER